MTRTFRSAIFLQFLGTVGSGIFVLPYVFYHSNFLFSALFLIFLGFVTGALNYFYCHIVASTSGDHQLAGYAQIYLGPRFKNLATLNLLLLAFGAITAYLKLFSSFLSLLLPPLTPFAPYIFLVLLFIFYLFKFKSNSRFQFLVSSFFFLIPIFLFFYSVLFVNHESYFINQFPNFMFYGATIFALSGFTIIPEVDEILRNGRHKKFETLALASLLGLALVVVVYLLFAYSVATLSGPSVSSNTVSGLSTSTPLLAKLISAFGLVITFNASLNFLTILHELFFRDLHFSEIKSSFLSFVFCVLCLVTSSISLITIISLTGDITIFISALIIVLIRLRLPYTFSTTFFAFLIMLCLTLGLLIAFI